MFKYRHLCVCVFSYVDENRWVIFQWESLNNFTHMYMDIGISTYKWICRCMWRVLYTALCIYTHLEWIYATYTIYVYESACVCVHIHSQAYLHIHISMCTSTVYVHRWPSPQMAAAPRQTRAPLWPLFSAWHPTPSYLILLEASWFRWAYKPQAPSTPVPMAGESWTEIPCIPDKISLTTGQGLYLVKSLIRLW